MNTYLLRLHVLSDATFGRGDGVAGLVDQEVEHDATGLPYLRGRTLKGLISDECDTLIHVLDAAQQQRWMAVRHTIFGRSGSTATDEGLHFSDAVLPDGLRAAVAVDLQHQRLTVADVLNTLTTIRRQTAIDPESGTPDDSSLRSIRVIHRDLVFTSRLDWLGTDPLDRDALALLAVGCLALRRIGTGRNRGRGAVRCSLHNANGEDQTGIYGAVFPEERL